LKFRHCCAIDNKHRSIRKNNEATTYRMSDPSAFTQCPRLNNPTIVIINETNDNSRNKIHIAASDV